MIPVCAGPDPAPRAPRFAVPPLACDTHAHVFGPAERYPYTPNRSYTPPDATFAQYRALLSTLGVERGVLVQPSVYGTDNRLLADTLRNAGPNFRGIAVLDASASDAELEALNALGVRGLRCNLLFRGGVAFADVEALARRVAPLGWHLQFLLDVSQFEKLEERLSALPVDSVIDHMGHLPAADGPKHPGFRALLSLLRQGRTWVKLSGSYRVTGQAAPPYGDVVALARALIKAAPDRCVWATDWPHPQIPVAMPNDGDLMDQLADWAPDAETRRAILVDNPARLYGF